MIIIVSQYNDLFLLYSWHHLIGVGHHQDRVKTVW